jgi:hypothetical protein
MKIEIPRHAEPPLAPLSFTERLRYEQMPSFLRSPRVLALRVYPHRVQNTFTSEDFTAAEDGGVQYSTILVQKPVRLHGITQSVGNTQTVTIESSFLLA